LQFLDEFRRIEVFKCRDVPFFNTLNETALQDGFSQFDRREPLFSKEGLPPLALGNAIAASDSPELQVFCSLDQVAPRFVRWMCTRSARLPAERMLSQRGGNRRLIKFQQVGPYRLPNTMVWKLEAYQISSGARYDGYLWISLLLT
jgi:hypothetical protein